MSDERPLVIVRPAPVRRERIFTPAAWQRLCETYRVVDLEDDDSEEAFAAALPEAFAVVGQPTLDAAAIARAEQLRCVLNVEGNFFPNVDYAAAHQHGMSYSVFINGLKAAGLEIDRKILADVAVRDPQAFGVIADQVRAAIERANATPTAAAA